MEPVDYARRLNGRGPLRSTKVGRVVALIALLSGSAAFLWLVVGSMLYSELLNCGRNLAMIWLGGGFTISAAALAIPGGRAGAACAAVLHAGVAAIWFAIGGWAYWS